VVIAVRLQTVKTAKNRETKPTGDIKKLNIRTNNCQEKLSEAKKIALRLKNPQQTEAHHHIGQHHFYIFEVK
jgi:type 1 fimbria pilin